jgi:hypothetical protein
MSCSAWSSREKGGRKEESMARESWKVSARLNVEKGQIEAHTHRGTGVKIEKEWVSLSSYCHRLLFWQNFRTNASLSQYC